MSARAASSCGSGFARRLAIALLVAVAAPLSGCTADPNPAGSAGVSVALYQTRSDVAAERLEIQIVNDGDETLVVTRAEYRGPEFSQVLS